MSERVTKEDFRKVLQIDQEQIENEIRSNLRYAWQRAYVFVITLDPSLAEIEHELSKTFMTSIPDCYGEKNKIQASISSAFYQTLKIMLKRDDWDDYHLEEFFIDNALKKIREILFP